MPDIGDKANDAADVFQDAALKQGLYDARKKETAPADFDGEHCVDCGNEIPEERLRWRMFRCVYCQQRQERQR